MLFLDCFATIGSGVFATMKRFFAGVIATGLLIFATGIPLASDSAQAASDEPVIYIFSQESCGHCKDELAFLASELPDIPVVDMELSTDPEYRELFIQVAERFGLVKGTPITIVGKTVIGGFRDGSRIVNALEESDVFLTPQEILTDPCARAYGGLPIEPDVCTEEVTIDPTAQDGVQVCEDGELCEPREADVETILQGLPLVGGFLSSEYSLPTIAGVLGVIDGFNPCAMWVLVVFLLALIQIGDRIKMMLVAGTFLLAEALMYTLILTLWLKTFDFVGISSIVTVLVGIVAIGAGGFFLWEGIFTDGTCKVTNINQRRKVTAKIHDIANNPLSWGMFVAILALAFSVNVIEFACSIGIPQSFTLILSQSALNGIETAGLIAIYIAGYMFDDLIVFGIALYSIEKIGITHKFSKATNIIGGTLMLLLGLLLIFAPDVLRF